MYKPDFEIEKPPRAHVTLETTELVLYLLCAFLAGMGVVVFYLGF